MNKSWMRAHLSNNKVHICASMRLLDPSQNTENQTRSQQILGHASLNSKIEPMSEEFVAQLLNPPEEMLLLSDPDHRLSLDIYLATTHTSEDTYTRVCTAVKR
ncbi:hypothetical protein D9758_016620 [Tetrapyrgos nigripes]|uniref:Uncharacterized protein n=1 Tax=Tetrapyrgos nigripes TaxID=182062 RepID=A0A8H5CA59_9AGAR|nr:hypothetical protein D9758_016620 [Tetrapyrgos nigripes]